MDVATEPSLSHIFGTCKDIQDKCFVENLIDDSEFTQYLDFEHVFKYAKQKLCGYTFLDESLADPKQFPEHNS